MSGPTTPHAQPSLSITHTRFSHHPLSLATTNGISLPMGTKMFHFPTFLPYWLLNSPAGNTPLQVLGSPIQKSPDQHSLVNSPRHIADRHVFHQLLIPRHPPNAHKNYKNKHTNEPTPNTPTNKGQMHLKSKNHSNKTKSHKNKDANNHYTIHQQPTPNTPNQPQKDQPAVLNVNPIVCPNHTPNSAQSENVCHPNKEVKRNTQPTKKCWPASKATAAPND